MTTKVGILPPNSSAWTSAAKTVARGVTRLLPGLQHRLRRRGGTLIAPGQFGVPSMTDSLHTSLRALRTDCIDLLLLHECTEDVIADPAVLRFLQQMKQQGKIRRFGIAADAGVIAQTVAQRPELVETAQLAHSPLRPNLHSLVIPGRTQIIVHSVFREWLQPLRQQISADSPCAARWERSPATDIEDATTLARLGLQYALRDARGGVVLFTSRRPEHIAANAAAAQLPSHPDEIRAFEDMVMEWNRSANRGRTADG